MSEELDIEKYLATEATQLQKDQEVERILSAFKLNPFDVLEIEPENCSEKEIKNTYRKKSLLIHPDKTKHPRAQEAFALLKKAETELSNEKSRAFLLAIIQEARATLCTDQKLKSDDPVLQTREFRLKIKQKTKDILIEHELRKRKLIKREMEAQGLAAQKAEAAEKERKRKAEEDKLWEETREQRVNKWRDFQGKKGGGGAAGSSKKKKKTVGEFRPPKVLAEDPSKPYIKRPTNSSS
ncbi:744_t:CDS:2 [Ambispora gerdemannii]|uniref:744_t:CDS:1 n=1 Tax=Ambispora gerdemannii TaxID=144530 RepID=A0A9N8V181_9GLOM|nr:744_t:CDS:2 [Ambispora gerdemannii]